MAFDSEELKRRREAREKQRQQLQAQQRKLRLKLILAAVVLIAVAVLIVVVSRGATPGTLAQDQLDGQLSGTAVPATTQPTEAPETEPTVMPAQTVEMCERFFNGDVAGSAALQCELLPLINALFCEVNPIPVKAAMAAMGFCENYLRLPLTPMEEEHYQKLLGLMRHYGLIA